MWRMRTGILPVIPLLGVLAACAKAPASELHAGEQAIEAAASLGADVFATQAFGRARAALAAARDELDAQQKQWTISRRYDKARQLLATVSAEADAAAAEAGRRGQSACAAARAVAASALTQAASAAAKAPDPRDGGYLKARRARLQSANTELEQADADVAARRYREALKAFETLAGAATQTATEVSRSSQGFLTDVETRNTLKYSVVMLTLSGVRSESRTITATSGMTLLVLRFAGDARDVPDGHFWVGRGDTRYAHRVTMGTEGGSQIVYEVPGGASNLVWHDGDRVYALEPVRAAGS